MDNIIKKLPLAKIDYLTAVSGGDVNDAYKVYADGCTYFLKVQKNSDKSFFDGEVAGLNIFNQAGINAPRVIAFGDVDGSAYLLMTYHEEKALGSQEELAKLIAKIHQVKSPNNKFGFDYPYKGTACSFSNEYKDSWKEVFLYERMDKLKEELLSANLWNYKDIDRYSRVREIIENSLDQHESKPVLLHGDLWSGNFMFDKDEKPLVFDPSPLYGDREFDIGISTVFGGFRKEFYKAYQDELKLDDGYIERLDFYRLYLFMVHLLKFGHVYDSSVNDVLKNIIGDKSAI